MKSLEQRFVVGLAIALLAVFGVLFWAAVTAVESLSEAYVSARLEHDAEALLTALVVAPDGNIRLRGGRITPIYLQPLSGHYFQLDFGDGQQIRSRSLWDEHLPVDTVAPGSVRTAKVAGPDGQELMLRASGYRKGDAELTLTVAEDVSPMHQQIVRFQGMALVGLLLALVVIVLSQRYILRRGFQGVDQVRAELRQIAAGERSGLQSMGPDEIRPLTAEVNRLLEHLQQRLQRSRQGLGNLAHALKSPLSLATRELDALPVADDQREQLAHHLERIQVLIERELKRARFAGSGDLAPFIPARQVPDLLDALRQLHRDRDLLIENGELPTGALPFDHEDMLELLGNLLDNACKWARHRVCLDIGIDSAMRIRVTDDGPGVEDAEGAAMVRRGGRLDEHATGHGLGLAIVNDLVNDYHGRIRFARAAELGGLEVTVELPVTRSTAGS